MDSDFRSPSSPEYIDPDAFERLKHELELLTSAIRREHPECSTATPIRNGMANNRPRPARG